MAIMYMQYDITEGIIMSVVFLIFILIFYLYKKENRFIMHVLVSQYKYKPSELPQDTRRQDWFLLIALLIMILILGFKYVTLMVVVSDSMKPEFERGDMILTQSINTTPAPGDIITFHASGETIAVSHRTTQITSNGIIKTKGDNNPYVDRFQTTQKDVIAKAITFNDHPIVIKGLGALFITDYKAEGVIYKWGDRFTFMQQISVTIKAWGYIITVIALMAYIILITKK